jgi:hypothetical protein
MGRKPGLKGEAGESPALSRNCENSERWTVDSGQRATLTNTHYPLLTFQARPPATACPLDYLREKGGGV